MQQPLLASYTVTIQPTVSVKALKEIRHTDSNQWPGLIFSSSTIKFLMEGALLSSYQLSDISKRGVDVQKCDSQIT